MDEVVVFWPRRSRGWLWPAVVTLLMPVVAAFPSLAVPPGAEGWWAGTLTAAIGIAVALPFLALAAWFPTMRYELV